MENEEIRGKGKGRPKGQSRSEMQCISYLTRDAMVRALEGTRERGEIGHWWAVPHMPDEEVKKVHWHLRVCPPPSSSVNWQEWAQGVFELVRGEDKPRRLVLSRGACNNNSEEGLLYARHDSKYLATKGIKKATMDYQKELFLTDSREWLEEQWAIADEFKPTPKKITIQSLIESMEDGVFFVDIELLRICLLAGFNKGQFQMLQDYQHMLRSAQRRAENGSDGE